MPSLRALMTPLAIKAVLFDLDGTLADTAPDLAYALNGVLAEQDRAPLPLDTIRPAASHGGMALIRCGFGDRHPEEEALQLRLLDIYQANIARETRLFPGMAEVLTEIEARGLNWGVVTNKPAWLTEPLLDALGLSQRAACIVSGDTCEQSKPHPQPILHACRQIGVTTQKCLYVGDAERDIEAGRRAGTHTLAALFGYIGENDRPQDWGADALIAHPGEILAWLKSR
ncbi:MAG: HAD-IA family hydrolase [Gammaproteobacteria bacterium]|nr:HAD-IA family hydrolase [Gammaproteobacteria bacterium]MCF6363205.1 HAD-IA family hydrolase [Gammaproteobacteria bacterium]